MRKEFQLSTKAQAPDTDDLSLGDNANYVDYATRTIYIYDDIDSTLSRDVAVALQRFKMPSYVARNPVIVKINSNGGSLYDTIAIVSEILNFNDKFMDEGTPHIITDVTGVAYSGAGMIALAGDTIMASKLSLLMYHLPLWSDEDKSLRHREEDSRIAREHFERIMRILLEPTRLTLSEFKSLTDGRELYLTPKKALKYGFVNEIY